MAWLGYVVGFNFLSFMVLDFIFVSVIHIELPFVYGVR